MSALMSDVIEGSVTPAVANAGIRAGALLLQLAELKLKHGSPSKGGGGRDLVLCADAEPEEEEAPRRLTRRKAG